MTNPSTKNQYTASGNMTTDHFQGSSSSAAVMMQSSSPTSPTTSAHSTVIEQEESRPLHHGIPSRDPSINIHPCPTSRSTCKIGVSENMIEGDSLDAIDVKTSISRMSPISRKSTQDDVEDPGSQLADRLSSSLASLATQKVHLDAKCDANNRKGVVVETKHTLSDPTGELERARVLDRESREALGSENNSTSDTSSNSEHAGGNAGLSSSTGANVVTAGTTTTNSSGSGEDRDSSAGNGSGSGSGSGGQEESASAHVHTHAHAHAHMHAHSYAKAKPKGGHGDGDSRERHYDRHGRQRRRSQTQLSASHMHRDGPTSGIGTGNDGYGLPVPIDDRIENGHNGNGVGPAAHATVVARLPPPSTDSGSSGSGAEVEQDKQEYSGSLLVPHREPAFHTIRRTFKKLPGRLTSFATNKSSETDSSADQHPKARKKGVKRSAERAASKSKDSKPRRPPLDSVNLESGDADPGGSGSSSGSGTEGGYAGSASSNENAQKDGSAGSSSSEIPDFSSGASESGAVGTEGFAFNTSPSNSPSLSSSSTGDGEGSSDDQEEKEDRYVRSESAKQVVASGNRLEQASTRRKRRQQQHDESYEEQENRKIPAHGHGWPPVPHRVSHGSKIKHQRRQDSSDSGGADSETPCRRRRGQLKDDGCAAKSSTSGVTRPKSEIRRRSDDRKPPILMAGCDVMAHVLTFLEPPDILDVLTMPLSKDWQNTFTRQQELWRVLCLLEPFKAQVDSVDSDDSSECSISSFSTNTVSAKRPQFGKYRLLYTSFVRCMRYLARIKDDAVHGRPPSMIDYGVKGNCEDSSSSGSKHDIANNRSLKNFFASARGIVGTISGNSTDSSENDDPPSRAMAMDAASSKRNSRSKDKTAGVSLDEHRRGSCGRKRKKSSEHKSKKKRKLRNKSFVSQNALGLVSSSSSASVELPWSCAIYSIVNWMVVFSDVEGIQIMILKVLPFLLEDERQRMTAQRAGLTDVVLRGMVLFPNSVQLHTVSFHTIVLLARPLGGREGMLFHSSMVNSSGIFSGSHNSSGSGGMFSGGGKNGIAVMLDSMRRFVADEALQAMSCWSLVNIALAPVQKEVLVKLGGIEVTANAMMRHPHNAEVQFRALFALINLVIPSVSLGETATAAEQQEDQEELAEVNASSTEEEVLDEIVSQVVDLVVLAMKNFCSSEAILNRACLVLHNLSLTSAYHNTLLWTPNCYQMLEWCLANYPTDQVLQQSAAGTLHRLQVTLSNDDNLRARFTASIQAQHRQSLEEAHREAIHIHEQQQELLVLSQEETGEMQYAQEAE